MTQNQEELAQTLFEESGDALFLFDPDSEALVDANPMAQRLSGYSRRELLAMQVFYLFRSETPGGLQRLRQACKKTAIFHSQEGFLLRGRADGVWIPVNLTITRLHAEPKTLGLITARDISERREAQALLQRKEAELRQILSSISDYLWSADIDPRGQVVYRYYSPVVEKITGRPPDFYLPGPERWLSTVHPEDRGRLEVHFAQLRAGRSTHAEEEYRIVRPDGTVRWVRDSVMVSRGQDGQVCRLDGVVTDVTERKHVAVALEERARVTALNAEIGIALTRGDSLHSFLQQCTEALVQHLGAAFARIWLLQEGEEILVLHASAGMYTHLDGPHSRVPVGSLKIGLIALERKPHITNQLSQDPRLSDPDWARREGMVAFAGLPLLVDDRLVGVLALFARAPFSDVALEEIGSVADRIAQYVERKRAEEALRASEMKYRCLIENLEQNIFLKDRDLRFVTANRRFCQGLGLSETEIAGKTDLDFYPPHLAEKYRTDDRLVLTEGQRLELEEENQVDGKVRTVRVIKTPVEDDLGRIVGVLGIFWDVTEQRVLEAQLRQAQKMEAIGQLAGGIAHDFNNLLTAILGNISLVHSDLPHTAPGRELLAAAEKAALRAAELTNQLLGFSRRTLLRPVALNLNTSVEETVRILRRTIDPRITLEVRGDSGLWTVQADPGQMNQVLMNLCLNARDAMPEGGRLQLETANVRLDEDYARLHLESRPGEFVRLRVSDTGQGMPAEIKARIFEPFFTTKGPGRGTGLGLAMVFGILKQHQGWIDCYSEPGQGTRFDIYLPRHGPILETSLTTAQPRQPAGGSETILLADDEAMIRNLGRAILGHLGYRVLLAEDGQQAVDLYQQQKDEIDMVILDLTMPRLAGRDALRQLLLINPDVAVLFASGYSSEHVSEADARRTLGFVSKPYRPEELAEVVRQALDRVKERKRPTPGR